MKRAWGGPPPSDKSSSSGGEGRVRREALVVTDLRSRSSPSSSETTAFQTPFSEETKMDDDADMNLGTVSKGTIQKKKRQKTNREMMDEPSGFVSSLEDRMQSLRDGSSERDFFYGPDETDMFERMAEGKLTLDEAMGRTPLEARRQRENAKLDLVRYKLESDQDLDDQEKSMLRDAIYAGRRDVFGRIIQNKEDYDRWYKYLWR
jgi:hypothetical protein